MGHNRGNVPNSSSNMYGVRAPDALLAPPPFPDIDQETARGILAEVARLAEGPVGESFADGDRNPPIFAPKTRSVSLPESIKRCFQALRQAEFWRLETSQELGGQVAPRTVVWGVAEQILGANPALHMYLAGPPFASVLHAIGNESQRRIAQLVIDRGWGSTMVLTEPDAGSDVGAGRTKAIPQPNGSWHIEGVKRFITSADQDLTENIVHLVLARPVGAGPGTKGLSLFVVPKFLFDEETGELGDRNGVYVTNVEHKMGLKVSSTCELTFGDQHPAVGYLVGEVHEGIRQMFQVIEHARMMVGT